MLDTNEVSDKACEVGDYVQWTNSLANIVSKASVMSESEVAQQPD